MDLGLGLRWEWPRVSRVLGLSGLGLNLSLVSGLGIGFANV